jgi:PLP dependent protein
VLEYHKMIKENVSELLAELKPGVQLLAAVKGREAAEVLEAIEAGIELVGENYVQEAERLQAVISKKVEWHFIGHLQKNKVKLAAKLFDIIETVDSLELAWEIDKRCAKIGKVMPVLVEVNAGGEAQKSGVYPEEVEQLVSEIAMLKNMRVMGLMTMGPVVKDPGELRPYFRLTRDMFERIRELKLPNVEMKYLSMGMSDSYRIAVAEGANIVRIGTLIFGPRHQASPVNR